MEILLTFNVSISNGSTEEFYWQIYWKNWFSDRAFYVTNADVDIGSLSLSIHYLVYIWTTWWWNLNKFVWPEPYKILNFLTKNGSPSLTKCWRHFGRCSCDWNNCLMLKVKYWFKDYHLSVLQNYGSSTRVTRLKVAPSMAYPTSLNENLP